MITRDIGARDIIIGAIVTIIFGLTVYTTAVMTLNIAKRNQDAVIKIAVSDALESNRTSLTCEDNALLKSITNLAENGIHLKGYKLKIEVGNIPAVDPWN